MIAVTANIDGSIETSWNTSTIKGRKSDRLID